MGNSRFTPKVLDILRRGGWYEGRKVPFRGDMARICCPNVLAIVEEFGGLHVGSCGAGVDFATSDVDFDSHAPGETIDEVASWKPRQLVAVAYACHMHILLVVDDLGTCYIFSIVAGGAPEFLAPTFDEGLQCLLLGVKYSPEALAHAGGRLNPNA